MSPRWFVVAVLVGCSSSSDADNTPSDVGAEGDSDALVCSALSAYAPTGLPPDYACPATFGSFDCSHFGDHVAPLSCATLDGYQVGFGIDTGTRCFYDRTTHAFVGVETSVNGAQTCFGIIDDTCFASPVNLCSGGPGDASADGD
jgi:hypothetical protein